MKKIPFRLALKTIAYPISMENIVKMSAFLKFHYSSLTVNTPMGFLGDYDKMILKFISNVILVEVF